MRGRPLGVPTTHGACVNKRVSREYASWRAMRARCLCPTEARYESYGGRGVVICDRWNDFANFLADMGPRPQGTSIDRIDNGGNYEPGNCRWATREQQMRNTRYTKINESIAAEIRRLAQAGLKRTEIAKQLDLSYSLVKMVVIGKSWRPAQERA